MRDFPPSPRTVQRSDMTALVRHWERALRPWTPKGLFSAALHAEHSVSSGVHEARSHYAASTVKLAVLTAVLREALVGSVGISERLVVHSDFMGATGRPFHLRRSDDQDDATWDNMGGLAPISDLLERMTVDSSNIATNLLVERIGVPAVQRILTEVCPSEVAFARLIGDDLAERAGITNTVSARGLACLLHAMAFGSVLPPRSSSWALDLLARQRHRSMIPHGLPPDTWTASKSGWTTDVRHDVALVRPRSAPPYVLAVCTSTTLGEDAESLVAMLSTITWEHWNQWHA